MKAAKMYNILAMLDLFDVKLNGTHIYATGAGELAIEFHSQPLQVVHSQLVKAGFVLVDTDYIYRPRTRSTL